MNVFSQTALKYRALANIIFVLGSNTSGAIDLIFPTVFSFTHLFGDAKQND